MEPIAALLGGGLGLGATLVIAGWVRPPPRLAALAATLNPNPPQPPGTDNHTAWARWATRPTRGVHAAELELVGQTRERFAAIRVGFALAGALLPPALLGVLIALSWPVPVVATTAISLTGAVIGWRIPPMLLRARVKAARRTFRRTLCAYFELVALERLADRGPVEALEHPTTIGHGWAFVRIRAELARARRRGEPPWQALRRLAAQFGINELDDLGAILTLSEEAGASIVDSLTAKAASMRARLLAEDLAAAGERNRLLEVPLSLLGLTIIIFLIFPGLYLLTTT